MSVSGDAPPRVRVLFLAGPVIWFTHFMAVYLLAEATCASGGFDLRVLGLPVLSFVTVTATVVAAAATAALTGRAYRRWRRSESGPAEWVAGGEDDGALALAGFLLGVFFVVAIVFVGVPALFLRPC